MSHDDAILPVTPAGTEDAQAAARVRRVIERECVAPHFQPIVNLETGEIAGFEALTRPTRDSGYDGPAPLFHDAEQAGLLWELEAVTRRKCLAAAEDFPDGVLLFFNSTPQVFADPRFVASLSSAVRGGGSPPPGRIVLEITEASQGQVVEGLAEHVRTLRSMGFQTAIDDVGAGTSGLNRMMLLRPQWLKLDRELIEGIDQDRFKHNLIRFLVHFARLSGVNVVAEGIERREELATLIGLGIRFGQGYYLAKPQSAYQLLREDLVQFLRQRWSEAHASRRGDPRAAGLGSLAAPAILVQSGTSVREVAADLLRRADAPGVAVLDGRRFVGWCPRDLVLRAAGGEDALSPMGHVTPANAATLPPSASVAEALELVSVRAESELTAPVIVAEADRIHGYVPLRALLSSAAGQGSASAGRADPLTGLPGRVAADQHLAACIQSLRGGARPSAGATVDVALIDLRGFEDFNGAYGYDLGDQLILDLAQLIHACVKTEPLSGSAGQHALPLLTHLGIDRFLVSGRAGELPAMLRTLVERFDHELGNRAGLPGTIAADAPARHGGAAGAGDRAVLLDGPARVGLRVLYIPNALRRIDEPRQLFTIERQLRQRALSMARSLAPGASIYVADERDDHARDARSPGEQAGPLRLTA